MKIIARGCLEFIVVWALCAAGLYYYLSPLFEAPGPLYGAIAGGFLLSASWGLIRGVFMSRARIELLSRARHGMMPQDGQPFAATGRVRALGEPLRTPITERPCICFGYTVKLEERVETGIGSERRMETRETTFAGGFAQVPAAIRAPIGDFKILSFPLPDQFPKQRIGLADHAEKLKSYMAAANVPEERGNPLTAINQAMKVFSETDGEHRYEWRSPNFDDYIHAESAEIIEECIPVDKEVTLIGTYSQQKGGIISDLAQGGLEFFPGGVDEALKALNGKVRGGIIGAIICALLGTGAVYGVLTARETRDSSVHENKLSRLIDAIATNDVAAAERELQRGASANNEQVLNKVNDGVSSEMLILLTKNGFDINQFASSGHSPLHFAVTRSNNEQAKLLIEAGADVNARTKGWGITPLEYAFDAGNDELIALLQAKGAKGLTIDSANGKPITNSQPYLEIVKSYLNAHAELDISKLREVTDHWPDDFMESVERGLYKSTRAYTPYFVQGWENNEGATVVIAANEGSAVGHWIFVFVKTPNGLKIRREGFDDNNRW